MTINLNTWAKSITLKEGLKKQLSIAQVKEVLRIILKDIGKMSIDDLNAMMRRFK